MRARSRVCATILKYRLQTTNILRTTATLGYSRSICFWFASNCNIHEHPFPHIPANRATIARWPQDEKPMHRNVVLLASRPPTSVCRYLRKLRGPSVWMAAGSCHCTGSIRNIGTKLQMRASLEANEPLNYATAEQRIEIGGAEQRHCACVHRRSSQVNWKIPIDRKLLDMFSIELEILG